MGYFKVNMHIIADFPFVSITNYYWHKNYPQYKKFLLFAKDVLAARNYKLESKRFSNIFY